VKTPQNDSQESQDFTLVWCVELVYMHVCKRDAGVCNQQSAGVWCLA